MSPKLQLLQRSILKQAPKPAESMPADDDLTAAIQRLVDQRVEQALEPAKVPSHMQRMRDQFNVQPVPVSHQPTPVQKKPMPAFETTWHRDAAGKVLWGESVDAHGQRFISEILGRNGDGLITGTRTFPLLPDQAYTPGTPRKRIGS